MTLDHEIPAIINIGEEYLDPKQLFRACIAEETTWTSKNYTSRKEDVAYCLLGLFQINMPLRYGGGSKVFLRLELEIIKYCNDESIFAWISPCGGFNGLLATSPVDFIDSGDIGRDRGIARPSYTMTNRDLQCWVEEHNVHTHK